MTQVHRLILGDYETNCYLVNKENNAQCCVIDPGYEPSYIQETLERLGLTPTAVLLTHGHFDHVGAVRQLAADYDCRVYLHEADLVLPPALTAGKLYYTDLYRNGDTITEASMHFRVIHTPGHTPGSVCLLTENQLFSGDTLFAGSCGRTDLPGGNETAMAASLRILAGMTGDLYIYPGHGSTTTLAQERAHNPYLAQFGGAFL